jgi:hypothetical protein
MIAIFPAFTIGASPSLLTCPETLFFSRGREEGSIEEELALASTRSRPTFSLAH